MKVLLLSDINSSHTQKWAISLSQKGVEIGVFSVRSLNTKAYENKPEIKIFISDQFKSKGNKINYLKALPLLKKAIKEFKPDIVHAHYASSYGLLGALSKFHPYILSVWGSDVYDFPNKSPLHKYLLKYNLRKADTILSTSKVMAVETAWFTNKNITVTPFGIDVNQFKPDGRVSNEIVIGTIKMLEEKYGVKYLVKAFAILKERLSQIPIKLKIIGGGSLLNELEAEVKRLNIQNDVQFTGFIEPKLIPACHNSLSIEVYPSISDSESFGVSVLEASACQKPVVVSNIGGLPEVVEDRVTGFVVPAADPIELANAIEKLVISEELRNKMGENGRERVVKLYNWNDSVDLMMDIYQSMVKLSN